MPMQAPPDRMSMELVLVFVIGSGWAILTGTLSLLEYVDRRRDEILLGRDQNGSIPVAHQRLLFHSDWTPFRIVLVGFVLVTSVAYLVLGIVVLDQQAGFLRLIGWFVAIFGGCGLLAGGMLGVVSHRERSSIIECLEGREASSAE